MQHPVTFVCKIGVGFEERLLDFECALHGVDRTGKFQQNSIPGELEDAALILKDNWVQHVTTAVLADGKSASLINTHQSAISNHIGRKDGSHSTLNAIQPHASLLRRVMSILRKTEAAAEGSPGPCGKSSLQWLLRT
jgi:hypothetical protein